MEDLIEVGGSPEAAAPARSRRVITLVAALALVLGGLALAKAAETPTGGTNVVSNVDNTTKVVDGASLLGESLGFGAAIQPQISTPDLIRAIVCPILAVLASGPFGAFIAPLLAALQAQFGCISP